MLATVARGGTQIWFPCAALAGIKSIVGLLIPAVPEKLVGATVATTRRDHFNLNPEMLVALPNVPVGVVAYMISLAV